MWYVPNISAANKNITINVSARVLKEQREREMGRREKGRPCEEM